LFFWSKNENPFHLHFLVIWPRNAKNIHQTFFKMDRKKTTASFGKRMKNPLQLHISVGLVTNEKCVVQTPCTMIFLFEVRMKIFLTFIFIFQWFHSSMQKMWTKPPLKRSEKTTAYFWREWPPSSQKDW